LKSQTSADRLGEAWYRLGEAHLELHNDKLAEGSFSRCIEQSGRYAYLARYQLARAELGHGNSLKAEEILQQNLALLKETDGDAYEKTLYGLGFVLYRNEKYSLAVQRLDLALILYPANSGAAQARFHLAECCRHLADAEQPVPGPVGPFAPELQHVRRQHVHWLDMAAAHYQKLVYDLDAKRAVAPLTESQRVLWRDAYFAWAKCRADGGHYEEASWLYETLSGLFQHEYHGLLALRQLYLTYELLTAVNPDFINKARTTIERAQQVLNVMEETVFKGRPEIENRAAWEKTFRQALAELNKDGSGVEP
jgi:tetratricopeptide (TPR) repeat protein